MLARGMDVNEILKKCYKLTEDDMREMSIHLSNLSMIHNNLIIVSILF